MEGGYFIMSSEHTIVLLAKDMTRNKLMNEKGDIITVLCRTIQPYKHTRNNHSLCFPLYFLLNFCA